MDTINNVTNAAANAVWGKPDSQQEPVSGVQGNTERGEPYDAGNMSLDHVNITTPTTETSANPADKTAEHVQKPIAADSAASGHHDTRDSFDSPEDNPVLEADLKKPIPQPLEQVARDAGSVTNDDRTGDTSATTKVDASNAPQESQGEGTSEKYVKSTGFAAEGGDFDAAKPGAGREADRTSDPPIPPPTPRPTPLT